MLKRFISLGMILVVIILGIFCIYTLDVNVKSLEVLVLVYNSKENRFEEVLVKSSHIDLMKEYQDILYSLEEDATFCKPYEFSIGCYRHLRNLSRDINIFDYKYRGKYSTTTTLNGKPIIIVREFKEDKDIDKNDQEQ